MSPYAGTDAGLTPYRIEVTDSGGKKAKGYLSGVGAGETLDSELVDGWTNATTSQPYETFTSSGSDITSAINTTGNGYAYKLLSAVPYFRLYKSTSNVTLNSGTAPKLGFYADFWGDIPLLFIGDTLNGSTTSYATSDFGNGFTSSLRYLMLAVNSASNFSMTNFSLKRVTDPPNTAVHIVSKVNGVTRTWTSVDTGFDPNAISTWSIYPVRSGPWNTFNQAGSVGSGAFQAGDSILLLKDKTYYGKIFFPSSGNVGNPITIGAYGTGAKPILNGSDIVTTWAGPSSGVYNASGIVNMPSDLFEDSLPLTKATSSACSDGNWYWASNVLYYKPTTGVPTDHTVSYATGGDTPHNIIDVSNKSNITIDGLSFTNFIGGVVGQDTSAASSNINIQNSNFTYGYSAIYFQPAGYGPADNIHVTNNYFYRVNRAVASYIKDAVATETNTNWVISNNEMVDGGTTDGTTLWPGANGDTEAIGFQNLQNGTIMGNYVHGGIQTGVILYSKAGGTNSGNSITRNKVYLNGMEALRLTGDGAYAINNNTFAYNIVWNSGKSYNDTRAYPIYLENGSGASVANFIYNNVIYGGYRLIRLESTAKYYNIENNVLAGIQDATFFFTSTAPTNLAINYNIYQTDGRFYYNSAYRTLAYIQANTAYGTKDKVADPGFTNASGGDFTLLPTSSAINAGTNVSLTTDYAGNTVPQGSAPDIGAYEFLALTTAPTSLAQYSSDGTSGIATGALLGAGTTIVFKFNMSANNNPDSLTPQIEIRPLGTAFTNTPNYSGPAVAYSGTNVTGVVTVSDLGNGTSYHWQARIQGGAGATSWTSYGNGINSDFALDWAHPGATGCSSTVTMGAPNLFEIRTTKSTATLYFAPPPMPYSNFYIAFSRRTDIWEYGTQYNQGYSGGVLSYTINSLSPNTKYYFEIRAGNGCATGGWGNTMSAMTGSSTIQKSFYKNIISVITSTVSSFINSFLPQKTTPNQASPTTQPAVLVQPQISVPTPAPTPKFCILWWCW